MIQELYWFMILHIRKALLRYEIPISMLKNLQVAKWLTELRDHSGDDIVLVIAGNKCDKESDRQINRDDAEDYAKRNNAKYFETSAKSNKGISEVFNYLGAGIYLIYNIL